MSSLSHSLMNFLKVSWITNAQRPPNYTLSYKMFSSLEESWIKQPKSFTRFEKQTLAQIEAPFKLVGKKINQRSEKTILRVHNRTRFFTGTITGAHELLKFTQHGEVSFRRWEQITSLLLTPNRTCLVRARNHERFLQRILFENAVKCSNDALFRGISIYNIWLTNLFSWFLF